MRQLRKVKMDKNGLKPYYCTTICYILAYASPVFCNFLSDTSKSKLEHLQDSATKIIESDLEYPDRLNNFSNTFSGPKLKHLLTLNTFKTHLVFQFTRHQCFSFGILKHFPKKHQNLERCLNFPIKRQVFDLKIGVSIYPNTWCFNS